MSRTITEKWPSTSFAAPMPTTLPSSRLITGTWLSCDTYMLLPRWPGKNDPPSPDTRGRPATIAPELSCALLSPAFCCLGTIAAMLPPPGRAVQQTDGRAAKVNRQPIELGTLPANRAVGMPAARGEIVGAHHDRPAVDLAPAADMVGPREARDPSVLVIVREACEAADLAKAACVEQQVDPLPAGQLAPGALADDARIVRIGREAAMGDRLQCLHVGK